MRGKRVFFPLFLTLILALGIVVGRATADQPHMQVALDHLRAAKGELEVAEHDKAGHRTKALDLVNKAITQVEMGIEAGRH